MAPTNATSISHFDALPDGFSNGASDPPPSTMAVQILDKIPTAYKPSDVPQDDSDDLTRLTKEVAAFEKDVLTPHDNAAKLEHKHKLIYVFARAVLEKLSSDDPFSNIPQLVSQASDILNHFAEAIKETPSVLDYVLPPGTTLEARGPEPLWVWLFPRVLTLLSRTKCESLAEKIKDFFYISFQAVSRSPKLWNLSSFFFEYLKECVSSKLGPFPGLSFSFTNSLDILVYLDNPNLISHGALLQITLPSNEAEFPFYIQESNDGSSGPFPRCNYVIRGATEAFSHASNLLSMLVDISMVSAASYDATPAFQDYLAWLLDSFCFTHELCKRWQTNSILYEACLESDLTSFCAVHALSTSLRTSLSPPLTQKLYSLLSVLCVDALENSARLSETPIRFVICSSILNLAAICKENSQLRRTVSLKLVPVVQAALANTQRDMHLDKDFEVS